MLGLLQTLLSVHLEVILLKQPELLNLAGLLLRFSCFFFPFRFMLESKAILQQTMSVCMFF